MANPTPHRPPRPLTHHDLGNPHGDAPDTAWSLRCHRSAAGTPANIVDADLPATVPGCVHTDLLAASAIPDPYDDANEAAVAWVAACDWRYTCRFSAPAELLAHDHVDLCFDGLDTLATIALNGEPIAATANMHRRYRFDVSGLLRGSGNELTVEFASATARADALVESEGVWPSSSFGRPFNYVRKMACSWGWDWGPQLTSAGIWRAVALVGWSDSRVVDVRPRVAVDAHDRGGVELEIDVAHDLDGVPTADELAITAELRAPDGSLAGATTVPVDRSRQPVRARLDAGTVARWWPHTHGPQPLYDLTVQLTRGATVIERRSMRLGFRTIELDTTPDATGAAFTFVVNGRPLFARGVNWIPDDVFPTRVTAERYRERLTQAIDAHVDMVRVWGGGIYEDDCFYAICDELGILVWQDFLFACAAYPEHLLRDEVEAEARDNVARLMHHPALAIWNGNNENIWGHADWGWEEVLQGRPWGAGFYHRLLPAVCSELDPDRPYWPGSPWSGSDAVSPNADSHGCVHVWDAWNQLDLARYRDHTPRFVVEFGWQAPASWATMADHIAPEHFRRDSVAMQNHQKAADGDRKLDRGIGARFGAVDDLESFWYAAQVVQARAVRTGIEHFRALRPYCMGTIWWQLNDCWPVTSWSVVDGAGRPKPAWYALREAYRPRLLTVQPRGDRLALVAVNDTAEAWALAATMRRFRLDGTELAGGRAAAVVAPWSAWSTVIDHDVAVAEAPTEEALVIGDAEGGEAWWWFAPDRELAWQPPRLVGVSRPVDGGVEVELSSSAIVRDVVLYPERLHPAGRADRQLITLRPGVVERIMVTGVDPADADALLRAPICRSVAELFV